MIYAILTLDDSFIVVLSEKIVVPVNFSRKRSLRGPKGGRPRKRVCGKSLLKSATGDIKAEDAVEDDDDGDEGVDDCVEASSINLEIPVTVEHSTTVNRLAAVGSGGKSDALLHDVRIVYC